MKTKLALANATYTGSGMRSNLRILGEFKYFAPPATRRVPGSREANVERFTLLGGIAQGVICWLFQVPRVCFEITKIENLHLFQANPAQCHSACSACSAYKRQKSHETSPKLQWQVLAALPRIRTFNVGDFQKHLKRCCGARIADDVYGAPRSRLHLDMT